MVTPSVSGTNTFYRDFEDQHRGSRELIKQRLRVYLAFIRPLASLYPSLPVVDVGCGRGEWLELLNEQNIPAHGVDADEGMLAACRERGLSATHGDAVEYLESQASHSLLAVTGFHVAEHLPFAVLQALLAQARRVLVPGGLLILETPNPENLLVGAANFYIDSTHERPLPSQLLVFLAEHQGFAPVKLLRLQEETRLAENGPVSLYDVLANVSPDYAIVAQAPQPPLASNVSSPAGSLEVPVSARQLAQAFSLNFGVSLSTLASRYDEQAQAHTQQLMDQGHQLTAQHQQLTAQHKQLTAQHHQLTAQHHQLAAQHHQLAAQGQQLTDHVQQITTQGEQLTAQGQQLSQLTAEVQLISQQAQQWAAQLTAVYASHSWRITAPLRRLIRRFRGGSGPR